MTPKTMLLCDLQFVQKERCNEARAKGKTDFVTTKMFLQFCTYTWKVAGVTVKPNAHQFNNNYIQLTQNEMALDNQSNTTVSCLKPGNINTINSLLKTSLFLQLKSHLPAVFYHWNNGMGFEEMCFTQKRLTQL